MIDENKIVDQTVTTEKTNDTKEEKYGAALYVEELEKLKRTTVPKEEFDKLASENRQLAQAMLNGRTVETEPVKDDPNKLSELRRDLFKIDSSLNNLEYAQKALELREECIKRGEPDPFLPWGNRISPTNQDREAAERVAATFKECIELADGDSQLFTNELMRRTNDVRYK